MGNTRLVKKRGNYANYITGTYPRIINGLAGTQYPSAPALSQDAQYPMSNLLNGDRYSPWKTPDPPLGQEVVEIDLGSNRTVGAIAILGYRLLAGQVFPNAVDVTYIVGTVTAPSFGYSTSGWLTMATIPLIGVRDSGVVLESPRSCRYLRFVFGLGATRTFAVGKIFLCNIPSGVSTNAVDVGGLYTAGADDVLVKARIEEAALSRAPVISKVGDDFVLLSLPFDSATTTLKDGLRAIAKDDGPYLLVDQLDQFSEVHLKDGRHSVRHVWDGAGVWDTSLELVKLP